jgi:hypothetical protein
MLNKTFSTLSQIITPVTPEWSLVSRRKALGIMGSVGAAIVAGSQSASGFFSRKPADTTLNYDELPAIWVERQGRNLNGYVDYIANLKLGKITVQQVISAHAKQKGSLWNSLPPQELWKNIGTTLKVIDYISKSINVPVRELVSIYRAPVYNARCAGAKRASWHQTNFACDVTFHTNAATITRTARSLRNRGLFRGGVGGYYGFTHIDSRGQNVDW